MGKQSSGYSKGIKIFRSTKKDLCGGFKFSVDFPSMVVNILEKPYELYHSSSGEMFADFSAEIVLETIHPHEKARFPVRLTNSLLFAKLESLTILYSSL